MINWLQKVNAIDTEGNTKIVEIGKKIYIMLYT